MAEITKNKKWNQLAIISTVLCFGSIYAQTIILMAGLLQPVALVLGIMAFKETRRTGDKGKLLSEIVIFFSGLATISITLPIIASILR